jgi:mRNA-degrading endonuclease RelE of RelBE toxin-antitoxin system
MDKISKALKKLTEKERKLVKEMLERILSGDFFGFDIKKLQGQENIYRIRKGKLRIIYYFDGQEIDILALERRSDNTYDL